MLHIYDILKHNLREFQRREVTMSHSLHIKIISIDGNVKISQTLYEYVVAS
jgi:hypothetical protein